MVIEYKIRFVKDGVNITQSVNESSDGGGSGPEDPPDPGGSGPEDPPDPGGSGPEDPPDPGGSTAFQSGGIAVVLGPLVISNARPGKKVNVTRSANAPATLKDVAPRTRRR